MNKLNIGKYTNFGERLKEVIGENSIKSFSIKSGLGTTTIQSYMKGTSYPTLDRLDIIAATAKVNINWLLTGQDDANINTLEYTKIPHFNVHTLAGTCSELAESGLDKNTVDINSQTLLDQGLNPESLLAMYVKGDSMEPSLFHGDMILIKKIITPFSILEGVYILRVFNEIFIKRIQFNKYSAKLKVDSDNPFYDSYTVTGDDLNDVEIIGEVTCTIFSQVRRAAQPSGESIIEN